MRRSVLLALILAACKEDEAQPQSEHVASYTIGVETIDPSMTVGPGETVDVTATIENTGDASWGTDTTWLAYVGAEDQGGVDLTLASETAAGETATFAGSVTAPDATGAYVFVWQPIIEGHELGTPLSLTLTVE